MQVLIDTMRPNLQAPGGQGRRQREGRLHLASRLLSTTPRQGTRLARGKAHRLAALKLLEKPLWDQGELPSPPVHPRVTPKGYLGSQQGACEVRKTARQGLEIPAAGTDGTAPKPAPLPQPAAGTADTLLGPQYPNQLCPGTRLLDPPLACSSAFPIPNRDGQSHPQLQFNSTSKLSPPQPPVPAPLPSFGTPNGQQQSASSLRASLLVLPVTEATYVNPLPSDNTAQVQTIVIFPSHAVHELWATYYPPHPQLQVNSHWAPSMGTNMPAPLRGT